MAVDRILLKKHFTWYWMWLVLTYKIEIILLSLEAASFVNPVNYLASPSTCTAIIYYRSIPVLSSYSISHAKVITWNITLCDAGIANNFLTGEIVNVSSPPDDAQLQCTFLPGFTGSAHCTVQYGTDPTYMNLPYSAESTETGTAGNTVSVVLRERLNSSTVYYYTASAVSGDMTVTVQGTFTIPQYSKWTKPGW